MVQENSFFILSFGKAANLLAIFLGKAAKILLFCIGKVE